jgi:hypothetical protein
VDYEPSDEEELSNMNTGQTNPVQEQLQIGGLADATTTGELRQQTQRELTEARLKARLTRDKIREEAIREYKNSREYKSDIETKVTARVGEVLNLARESKLRQREVLKTKLLAEAAILNPILQSPMARERFFDINKGITPKIDYLTYEQFLETRHVPLWDCRGSVANICREARDEVVMDHNIILPDNLPRHSL